MKIYIVGLGQKDGDISISSKNLLQSGKKIVVRTTLTNSFDNVKNLSVDYISLDFVYEKSRNFDTLSKNLANEVLNLAKSEEVVYCVDGAVSEDNSAKEIIKRHKEVEVFEGVSKVSAFLSLSNISSSKCSSVSAYEVADFSFNSLPVVVYDIDSSFLAGDIKLKLCSAYGDEAKATFICNNKSKKISLFELDRQKEYNYSCGVVIDEIPLKSKERFSFADLVKIIMRLREPDGCPWDRGQTNESIRICAIEEAYELVEGIELDDDDKILEESGDVLLQAVFHAVIKEEQGAFSVDDMLSALCKKLVDRHSHIFGDDKANDEKQALNVWEKNKSIEKNQNTASDAINDIPKNLPSAMFAQKVQKRAGKSGFDYKDVNQAIEDLLSELEELKVALSNKNEKEIASEAGDVLFSAVNIARKSNVDSEISLRDSANKFAKRFIEMEKIVISQGKTLSEMSLEEMESYYKLAKENLK